MRNSAVCLLMLSSLPFLACGQRMDPTASFRTIQGSESSVKYFRFHYDNDFLGRDKTDRYYTQGYSFELGHPGLRHNPLAKTLLRLKASTIRHGLAFEHLGFTPTRITSNEILRNDRPFAGVILLRSFAISIDTLHHQRLSTTLSTGMMGPAAFAGRMQATIHRWSGDVKPSGWQYQIGNDMVLNYELTHEKLLLQVPSLVSATTYSQVRLGTLSDRVQAGLTLTLGRFLSPLVVHSGRNSFQLFGYSQPLVGLVAYDATLQGGVFNRKNPYTLGSGDLSRVVFQHNFGLVGSFWKLYAEYYRTSLSREFKTGQGHRWGGIKLGCVF